MQLLCQSLYNKGVFFNSLIYSFEYLFVVLKTPHRKPLNVAYLNVLRVQLLGSFKTTLTLLYRLLSLWEKRTDVFHITLCTLHPIKIVSYFHLCVWCWIKSYVKLSLVCDYFVLATLNPLTPRQSTCNELKLYALSLSIRLFTIFS